MNSEPLQEGLHQLSVAQTSKEFAALINNQPALLEKVHLQRVEALILDARRRGDTSSAEALENLAIRLAAAAQTLQPDIPIKIEQLSPETSVAWARLTRAYLARRREELLDEAINAARRSNEKEVVELLLQYRDNNAEHVYRLAERLFQSFQSTGRSEEALTTRLIRSDVRAQLVERFTSFPQEQWTQVINMGLLACHQAAASAEILSDDACRAFYAFLRGNGYVKGQYLIEAEAVYEEALSLRRMLAEREPETYAPDVAATLQNLAIVRSHLRKLNEAEAAYDEALSKYRLLAQTRETFKSNVASALDGLGIVRRELGKLNEAEAAHQAALELRLTLSEANRVTDDDWDTAIILNNLGIAQDCLAKLSEAEATFARALAIKEVLARENPGIYESSVAATLNNLGAVQRKLGKLSEAEETYEKALNLKRALAHQDPNVYESDIVSTRSNLANVLSTERKFEKAKATYEEALKIARARDLPIELSKVLSNLGGLAILQTEWSQAEGFLREAVQQVERLRTEGHNLSRRRQVLRENISIYERLLVSLLKQGEKTKIDEALVIAEQGKSRAINDLLASREFRPKDEELARERDRLLVKAQVLEDSASYLWTQLQGMDHKQNIMHRQQLDLLRKDLIKANEDLELLAKRIRQAEPEFLPFAPTLSLDEIKQVARDAAAVLLMFRVTRFGSFVFLIFPDGETDSVEVSTFTVDSLARILGEVDADKRADSWGMVYDQRQMATRQRISVWMGFIKGALNRLYHALFEPVHKRLREKRHHMKGSERLIIVPNRGLAILPVHACWWEEDGEIRHLLDEYVCAYAPSLYILNRCLSRKREFKLQDKLLGLANPTGDLAFAEWECTEIEKVLGRHRCTIRCREQATKENLFNAIPGHQLLHFSCHGLYNLAAPLQSTLTLADSTLELSEVMAQIDLRESWLTVLSACETSLGDYREIADEQYGLPLGFLVAGTPTVWGALWATDDFSTALLMKTAYQNLKCGMDKPEALRAAQLQLRDMTAKQIYELLVYSQITHQEGPDFEDIKQEYWLRITLNPTEKPLAHPYYWAALQCVGV